MELVLQEQDDVNSAQYNLGPLGIKVKQVHLRVSSSKLICSPRRFQALLENSEFEEACTLREKGSLELELLDPEDDPTAMMIILGIMYGKDVRVPSEIDFAMLEKVTILVDKYQWHALVNSHAKSWFDSVLDQVGIPQGFYATLLTWLWISLVCGIGHRFNTFSRIAMQHSSRSVSLTDEMTRVPARVISTYVIILQLILRPDPSIKNC